MRISTKGRYAIRVMIDLAMSPKGECIKVKDIAKRQHISEKYLEQIIGILNRAGMVRSVRGAKGGYHLVREPEEYNVEEILRLTEGSLAPVACLDDDMNLCERASICASLELWEDLYVQITDFLKSVTLKELADKQRAKLEGFHI